MIQEFGVPLVIAQKMGGMRIPSWIEGLAGATSFCSGAFGGADSVIGPGVPCTIVERGLAAWWEQSVIDPGGLRVPPAIPQRDLLGGVVLVIDPEGLRSPPVIAQRGVLGALSSICH